MSFRFKTLLGFFTLITFSVLVIVWSFLHFLKTSHEQELEKDTRQLTDFLVVALKDKIIQKDSVAVTAFLNDFYRRSDIFYIRIITPPTVLATVGNSVVLKHQFNEDLHVADVKDGIFDTVAYISQAGQPVGRIEMGVLTIPVFTALEEAKAQAIYYVLFLLSFMLALAFLLTAYLTRPLKQLTKLFHTLAQKDASLVAHHKDELFKTVTSFIRLTRKYQQIQQASQQNQRAAEYSKQRLDTILSELQEGVVMINAEGIILSFNPAAERMFGYQVTEIVGQKINVLMPEPYNDQHQRYLNRYLTHKEKRVIDTPPREVTALHSNGETFPILLSVCELQHVQESIFIGLIQDLTQQKIVETQLHQTKALKNAILKRNPNAIVAINQTGHIIEFNVQAEQLFGYAQEDVLGLPMDEVLIPYAARQAHRLGMERYLASGESVVLGKWVDMTALHQQGHELSVKLTIMPEKTDEGFIFIAVLKETKK